MQGAVTEALDATKQAQRKAEENATKKSWDEYKQARDFDKGARSRYAVDRRYAAGTADTTWAVDTNLIGSFIDILVAFLYARNPDVSVKKTPRVEPSGTKELDDFAETLQIVISSLWTSVQTRLKANARKQVRSALSVGPGWIKAFIVCNGTNIPQMQSQLNDIRDNIASLEALRSGGQYPDEGSTPKSPEELDAELQKARELEQSIQQRVEVALRKKLVVDFVSAADVQVALNVPTITDYVEADWIANRIYKTKEQIKEMFPRLTEKDLTQAKQYFLKPLKEEAPLPENSIFDALYSIRGTEDDSDSYTSSLDGSTQAIGADAGQPPCFYCVVEKWDRRTNHVHTMIEGVKIWAKEPYQPDYPSTRFYPYFEVEFYSVDGARHPQSLSWRLRKLQDEYARSRSNFRTTRERSIPGVIFNAGLVEPDDVKKLEASALQELVGIRSAQTDTPLDRLFAPKPVANVDMRLYDNQPILADMEKIAGVQEALQSSVTQPKTAREAEIQNSGFASRTSADRDNLEIMLTDLAQYTAEQALTALSAQDVQRIAGAAAFWPEGMAIDDLLTMVEIKIEAGTTGKPREAGDREAWGVVMPVIKETIMQMQQALLTGNEPLAKALKALLTETMKRMGETIDVDEFLPIGPAPMQPPMALPGGSPATPGGDEPPPPAPGAAPPGDQALAPLAPLIQPVPTG